jgi:hypothetical protein
MLQPEQNPQQHLPIDDLQMVSAEVQKGRFIEEVRERLGRGDTRFSDVQEATELADYLGIKTESERQLAVGLAADTLEKQPEMKLREYMSRLEAVDLQAFQEVVPVLEHKVARAREEFQVADNSYRTAVERFDENEGLHRMTCRSDKSLEDLKTGMTERQRKEKERTQQWMLEHEAGAESARNTQGLIRALEVNWQTLSQATKEIAYCLGINPSTKFAWETIEDYVEGFNEDPEELEKISEEQTANAKKELTSNGTIYAINNDTDRMQGDVLSLAYFRVKGRQL